MKLSKQLVLETLKQSPFNIHKEDFFVNFYDTPTIKRYLKTLQCIPVAKADETILDIGSYATMASLYHDIFNYKHIGAISKYDWDALSKSHEEIGKKNDISLSVHILDVEKERLPYEDNSVDTILMLEILEHFALDPMFVLEEVNRILKPNGTLILTTPNASDGHRLFRSLLGKNPINERYNGMNSNRHNRLYASDELIKLAANAGFKTDKIFSIQINSSIIYKIQYLLSIFIDFSLLLLNKFKLPLRGEILITRLIKVSTQVERIPDWLYADRKLFKDWYKSQQKQ